MFKLKRETVQFNQLTMILVLFASLAALSSLGAADPKVLHATCTILKNSGVGPIEGTIRLSQNVGHDVNNRETTMIVDLSGFEKTSKTTLHGFHVHAQGGLGNKCNDAGGHYNPLNHTHGGQADTDRHVGDLGNIDVSDDGTVKTSITDQLISLAPPYSVLDLAIVVHALVDDLGRGGFNDSKTTGHAGARLGCCIIVANPEEFHENKVHRRRTGGRRGRRGKSGRGIRGGLELENNSQRQHNKCRGH